jgi:cobalt/nickel transport system permease protein
MPDGVLPLWLVLFGWALTLPLLALSARALGRVEQQRRLPLIGVVAALMLVGMTLELAPIGYHINLTVLGGILLRPAAGFIAAFVVDLILGLLGHGGITVVGLNTLVIGAEVVLGFYLFRLLWRWLGRRLRLGPIVAATTFVTLLASTIFMIGIVGLSRVDPFHQTPEATVLDAGALSFQNPLGRGVLVWELFGSREMEEATPDDGLDLGTFATIVFALGLVGWVIEAAITAAVATAARRLRPDLLHLSPIPSLARGGEAAPPSLSGKGAGG